MEYYKLSDGNKIPAIGFGTYTLEDKKVCKEAIKNALKAGYRAFDTAQSFFNEEYIGEALQESEIDRKELFITTKVWNGNYSYEETISSIKESIRKLKVDYLDLVLLDQPCGDYYSAWRGLVELKKEGLVKSIGVSNFYPDRLADLCIFNGTGQSPVVNQIETHPFCQQIKEGEANRLFGTTPQGWAPFAEASNGIFTNSVLVKIAKKHNKTVGQIILRWLVERKIPFNVKSVHYERMIENISIFDFKLDKEDMKNIASLDTDESLYFNEESIEGIEVLKRLQDQRRERINKEK